MVLGGPPFATMTGSNVWFGLKHAGKHARASHTNLNDQGKRRKVSEFRAGSRQA